jgi:hypothetical protein
MIAPLLVLRQAGVIPTGSLTAKSKCCLRPRAGRGDGSSRRATIAAGSAVIRAAEAEAFEEAGVRGVIEGGTPLGSYTYLKRLASGDVKPAVVEVYLLRTIRQAKKWREKAERTAAWVSIEEAIARHGEPGLAPLLGRLLELERVLAQGHEAASSARFGSAS